MTNKAPIVIQVEMATLLGLNEAIFIQQLHLWLQNSAEFINSVAWYKTTLKELQEFFPFFRLEQLDDLTKKLYNDKLIEIKVFNSGNWNEVSMYRIEYKALNKLFTQNSLVETEDEPKESNNPIVNVVNSSVIIKEEVSVDFHKPHSLKDQSDSLHLDIKRVVNNFDTFRKKLQPSFVRQEFKNQDGQYILRLHIAETGRTPEMFNGAIRWLFSDDKEARFLRNNIMNISSLVQNYNKIEMLYIAKSSEAKVVDDTKRAVEYYRKKGYSDEAIAKGLKDGTL
ncbi:MAG: hypothetical protein GQ570_08185 [Helicobacteraceae bacterium]|nr:hypothetical protein [Helicobacteraceae bacterium]